MTKEEKAAIDRLNAKKEAKRKQKENPPQNLILPGNVQMVPTLPLDSSKYKPAK
jgi:hypothetical protein